LSNKLDRNQIDDAMDDSGSEVFRTKNRRQKKEERPGKNKTSRHIIPERKLPLPETDPVNIPIAPRKPIAVITPEKTARPSESPVNNPAKEPASEIPMAATIKEEAARPPEKEEKPMAEKTENTAAQIQPKPAAIHPFVFTPAKPKFEFCHCCGKLSKLPDTEVKKYLVCIADDRRYGQYADSAIKAYREHGTLIQFPTKEAWVLNEVLQRIAGLEQKLAEINARRADEQIVLAASARIKADEIKNKAEFGPEMRKSFMSQYKEEERKELYLQATQVNKLIREARDFTELVKNIIRRKAEEAAKQAEQNAAPAQS
jgi:hypothetical protein